MKRSGFLKIKLKKAGKENELKELNTMLASFEIEKLKNIPATEMIEKAKEIINR